MNFTLKINTVTKQLKVIELNGPAMIKLTILKDIIGPENLHPFYKGVVYTFVISAKSPYHNCLVHSLCVALHSPMHYLQHVGQKPPTVSCH